MSHSSGLAAPGLGLYWYSDKWKYQIVLSNNTSYRLKAIFDTIMIPNVIGGKWVTWPKKAKYTLYFGDRCVICIALWKKSSIVPFKLFKFWVPWTTLLLFFFFNSRWHCCSFNNTFRCCKDTDYVGSGGNIYWIVTTPVYEVLFFKDFSPETQPCEDCASIHLIEYLVSVHPRDGTETCFTCVLFIII